jgi:type VI secretion system secreted protein VgrG
MNHPINLVNIPKNVAVLQKFRGRSTMIIRRASEADFTFTANEYDGEFRVLKFSGNEGISIPFRYAIKLAALDSEIDFTTIVGKSACLGISHENGERYVNGIITRFTQLGKSGTGRRFTIYHAECVPLIWLLKYRHGCRIFQNMTFEDIIRQVFQDAGVGSDYYRFSLTGTHNSHEYCVQYRESEFDFISRLMEEEGMFYYFEHTEDLHVMVIADDSSAHSEIESSTIVYNEASSMVNEQEYVYEFKFLQQVKPSSTSLRDFNYERPSLGMDTMSLSGDEDMLPEEENLEIYDYPGDYEDPDFGVQVASIRLDSLKMNRQMGVGRSVCRRFLPGYRFTLDRHDRSSFNQEYLITHLNSLGTQPLGENSDEEGLQYNNDFECIAYSVPFRPPRKTPRPIIDGIQTAYVVGPGGDDIYFDEMGRVKVQFHWDRVGQKDENSSCWVRVSDGYAGQNHGMQFPPLVGDEVIVSFLEGDPDRPLITGRVYNGENLPPLDPQESIQNEIYTPYGHILRFDDKKQAILMRTKKGSQIRMRDEPSDSSDEEKGFGDYISVMVIDGHQIIMAYGEEHKHIKINTAGNHVIELNDKGGNISITSAGGHIVLLDDAGKAIGISSTNGHYVAIDDNANEVIISDANEEQEIVVTSGGNITITNATNNIELNATSGAIKLDASNIDIFSSGDISLTANGKLIMEAGNIEEKGINGLKMEGGPTASLKAGKIDINGAAKVSIQGIMVEAKGTPIKLN